MLREGIFYKCSSVSLFLSSEFLLSSLGGGGGEVYFTTLSISTGYVYSVEQSPVLVVVCANSSGKHEFSLRITIV
jgi:hypothetical protein